MSAENNPESSTRSAPDGRRRRSQIDTRAQILDSALRLFAKSGFDGTSVEAIANESQVSKPVVYEHFGGKEGIYAVVLDRELNRLLSTIRSTIDMPAHTQSRPLAHILPKLVAALFEYVEDSSDGFRVLTNSASLGGGTTQNTVINEIAHIIEDVLATAGFVEPIARTYAQAIAGMLVHSAVEWTASRSLHRVEIVDYLTDFALNGVAIIDAPGSRRDVTDLVVYTSANDGSDIRDAMLDLLEIAGWSEIQRDLPQLGSWYQRLWLRGKDNGAVDKLNDVAAKLERSLTLKHIAAPRSENDEREAAAIERLAKATENVDEVAIKTSSILFVKHQGQMIVRVLTEREIEVIEKHPSLMRHPADLLAALETPPALNQLSQAEPPQQIAPPAHDDEGVT